jgi:hypothetical protein
LNRQSIDLTTLHERASATPEVSHPARSPRASTSSPAVVSGEQRSLRATQEWFLRAVTTPETEPWGFAEAEAPARLTSGPRMGAIDRLDVYRRAYHARLVECLADDYPVLRGALGADAFAALALAYVTRFPSRSPSLNFYGCSMADLLRSDGPTGMLPRPFAADLAALEWAIVEVIHAPSSEPLAMEALAAVPPDAWANARLVGNTALRLLRFEYPVNRYFQRVREDTGDLTIPSPEPSATVVYRSGPTIWRMDLTEPMFAVLHALLEGQPLAESLGRAEPLMAGAEPNEIGARVTHWFREWVSSGLFVRVSAGD